MDWRREWKWLLLMVGGFVGCMYLPVGNDRFDGAVLEGLRLVKWYAQEHVLLCLVPAFFIAGGISVFLSQGSVLKYLGAGANKVLAYGVAAVSGSVLAVCSCTVLPLFAGIYKMGAGLGPATAFLYAGPAINVLAIVLTARVLGIRLAIGRAVGAIVFSVVIGVVMQIVFRKDTETKANIAPVMPDESDKGTLGQKAVQLAVMVGILVFANWGKADEAAEDGRLNNVWQAIYTGKWFITAGFALVLAVILVKQMGIRWWKVGTAALVSAVAVGLAPGKPGVAFGVGVVGLAVVLSSERGKGSEWLASTWVFAKQIMPLLLAGVVVAGMLLGSAPEREGLVHSEWVSKLVGGNTVWSSFFASLAGALMYFATLTEIPIVQGLMSSGMGSGPALALLLAGPALSLPNMLVIGGVMGARKTAVYIALVVVMATISGVIYGRLFWIGEIRC